MAWRRARRPTGRPAAQFLIQKQNTGDTEGCINYRHRDTPDASRISGGLASNYVTNRASAYGWRSTNLIWTLTCRKTARRRPRRFRQGQRSPRLNPLAGPSRRRRRCPSRAATAALNDLFDAIDANIDVTAGRLTVAGETARQVKLDLTIFDRAITLREASVADFAGLAASLAGTVSAKGGKPAFSIDHAIALRDPARFARFSGTSLPTNPSAPRENLKQWPARRQPEPPEDRY